MSPFLRAKNRETPAALVTRWELRADRSIAVERIRFDSEHLADVVLVVRVAMDRSSRIVDTYEATLYTNPRKRRRSAAIALENARKSARKLVK